MNIFTLRRPAFFAVPLLFSLMAFGAQGAAPSGTDPSDESVDAPAASAAAPAAEDSDWQEQSQRHARRARHNRHPDGDLVNIGHDSTLAEGQKSDSVVSIFGSSSNDGDAVDVVSVFGDTRVTDTGTVHDNAVAVMGNVYIDGKVEGDVVAVLGNLQLGPHAQVEGDVFAIGGTLQRDPAAIVHGGIQDYFSVDFGGAGWLRTWIHHCLLYGRPLALVPGLGWAWGLALSFLALYAALALVFRDGITRCVQTFETHPGQSVLAALMAILLTPVLVVLLFVTVVGIAAVPFVVFGLFCAGLFGKAVMLAWLGRRVTNKRIDGPMSHPAVAVLIGGVLVTALYLVPFLGFIVYKLLGVLGLGAVVYTLILGVRAHQASKASPRPVPPAGPPPANAGAATGASAAMGAATAFEASVASGAPLAAGSPGSDAAPPAGPTPVAPPHASITAALPRAGFWVRMVALLLDAILIGFLMSVLHIQHLELLALAAYGAVMWKTRGTTIGGIVLDLRVVRLDGREIDWETAIVRALGCFLSLVVVGLGFFWIAFDPNSQGWHDKIAGTVVVRVAKGTPLI